MIFQINVRTSHKKTDGKSVYVCWYQKNSHQLKRSLGHFRFYHYLQNLFTDFSDPMRKGDIEFCNPGEGNICITWNLKGRLENENIASLIRTGLDRINIEFIEKYEKLYSIKHVFQLINPLTSLNSGCLYSVTGEILSVNNESLNQTGPTSNPSLAMANKFNII